MVFLKNLLLTTVIIATISCSDKSSDPVTAANPQPQDTEAQEQENIEDTLPTEEIEVQTPITTSTSSEKYVDTYTSVLIQEVRNQIKNDPLSSEKRMQNVEFANRIFKVDYIHGTKSKLSITTYTDKVFNFVHSSSAKDVQYFNAFEGSKDFISSGNRTIVYSAEAKTIKSIRASKTVTIIKIKDLSSNSIVHIFHVKKIGTVTPKLAKGYDYSRELTKISKVFLDRTRENPEVVGEFYDVITEEKNNSNASRFELSVSNNFILGSQPLVNYYGKDKTNLVPLSVNYKNFYRSFVGRVAKASASYISIKDSSYVIESNKNPVELSALNLELQLEAKEKIKGQKYTLPVTFFIKFK